MEVRILTANSDIQLECVVNEYLARTPYPVVDIKFSTCTDEPKYSAMIVYDA